MLYNFEGYKACFRRRIDTTRQIAETLYFSLSGVDCLYSKALRHVYVSNFGQICYAFTSGVDLRLETLAL
jgi:hypothetical protein